MGNLLNGQALGKSYGARKLFENLTLGIDESERLGLIGPNGSGKSTLLKLITGIERPDAGDIQFDGVSILNAPPNKRGAVFMFQKSYLFPFLR